MTAINPSPAAPHSKNGEWIRASKSLISLGEVPQLRGNPALRFTPFPAAEDLPGSLLAADAYPGVRRLLFQIAEGMPNPLGNGQATSGCFLPSARSHQSRSSQHQPMHNLRGCRSERNKTIPVRVGNDADLRAGRLHSPESPVLRLLVAPLHTLVGHLFHPSFSPQTPLSSKSIPT